MPGSGGKFVAPPMEPAKIKAEVLKDSRRDFYTTFFLDFANEAKKEATATEIKQDARSGVEAFLVMHSRFMDEFENNALFFLEQTNFPGQPDVWGGSTIKRGTDCPGVDLEDGLGKLLRRHVVGGTMPVDVDTLTDIAKSSLEENGMAVDDKKEAAIKAVIEAVAGREAQSASLSADFGLVV